MATIKPLKFRYVSSKGARCAICGKTLFYHLPAFELTSHRDVICVECVGQLAADGLRAGAQS